MPGGSHATSMAIVDASASQVDIKLMRDQVFFEGVARRRRVSRYWLLLLLSTVIAAAGVVSDSTAAVIGAMIIAPLMAPILGVALGVVLADWTNLRRCLFLLVLGAVAVVAVSWLLGHFIPYPVVAATNSQVAGRVTPRIVDLVAALATGSVGSVALTRSDVSDTLPGVAIAISLVPPLAVAGLTLESGAPRESVGALLLFATNVAAILASGIAVMALYRVGRASRVGRVGRVGRVTDQRTASAFGHLVGVVLIIGLLVAVLVPLWGNSERIDKTATRQSDVREVAEQWASDAGWSIVAVTARDDVVLVDATGPRPAPDLAVLRQDLDADGLAGLDVRVSLITVSYQPLQK
jgi:uncharacterized hydrophobic protein (TIGR00271 family)